MKVINEQHINQLWDKINYSLLGMVNRGLVQLQDEYEALMDNADLPEGTENPFEYNPITSESGLTGALKELELKWEFLTTMKQA